MPFYLIGNKSGKLNTRHKQEGAIRTSSSRTVCTRAYQPRVFNSSREKNRSSPIKPKYREYRNFLFLFFNFLFSFLIYFLVEQIFKKSISAGKKNIGPRR